MLRGIAMLRVLQPDSLYRRSGRCHHCRASHRGAEAWSHLLAEPPSSPLLAPFATFSTSNRRHAASYQGMDCKSHRGAETWSHLPLNRLALRCRRRGRAAALAAARLRLLLPPFFRHVGRLHVAAPRQWRAPYHHSRCRQGRAASLAAARLRLPLPHGSLVTRGRFIWLLF